MSNYLRDFLREEYKRVDKAINTLRDQEEELTREEYLEELSELLEDRRAIKLDLIKLM